MASRSTQRMARFDALVEQNRTRKAEQRFQFKQQREQAAQNANLERRGRAEEWRGMTAGMKAGEGYHTLADRQAYIVGGKLPEGVARPQRPSYVAAGVEGLSTAGYKAREQDFKDKASARRTQEAVAEAAVLGAMPKKQDRYITEDGVIFDTQTGQPVYTPPQDPTVLDPGQTALPSGGDPYTAPLGPFVTKPGEVVVGASGKPLYQTPFGLQPIGPAGSIGPDGKRVEPSFAPQKPTVLSRGDIAVDAKGNLIASGQPYTARPTPHQEKMATKIENYFGQNPDKLEDFKKTEAFKNALASGSEEAMMNAVTQYYHTLVDLSD